MPIFYAPEIESNACLPEEESQHAIKVLRMQSGDKLSVVDGKGGFFSAEITVPHHKRCEVSVLDEIREFRKRNFRVHIAIAPTKNIERLEWFAEKVTEIGIDEITPVICRFSERKVVKHDRLEKLLVSAMKQSVKAYLPVLNEQCSFSDFMKRHIAGQKFICHCYEQDKRSLSSSVQAGSEVTILVGPEGDFSEDEVSSAIKNGYLSVSLGESRLRTETAGVVACHTVALLNELNS